MQKTRTILYQTNHKGQYLFPDSHSLAEFIMLAMREFTDTTCPRCQMMRSVSDYLTVEEIEKRLE